MHSLLNPYRDESPVLGVQEKVKGANLSLWGNFLFSLLVAVHFMFCSFLGSISEDKESFNILKNELSACMHVWTIWGFT